jgi:hypothetical protein
LAGDNVGRFPLKFVGFPIRAELIYSISVSFV